MHSSPEASSLSQWVILLRAYWRIQRSKVLEAFLRARLKTFTIVCFLLIYVAAAYFLLDHGFRFISNLPAAGNLIIDRLIHVVFFCFMIMLIFSSAVTAYISIYRGRDVSWLLTLPLSHRVAFLWKCFEAALFSTWGLLVIIAPLLLSFARQREVGPDFFLKSILALIPFLIICSSLGSFLLILVGRFLNRRQFAVIAIAGTIAFIAGSAHVAMKEREVIRETGLSAALTFQRVLGHTDLATNRLLPSTWLASSIVEWSHPYSSRSNWLPSSLLLSNSLMLPFLLSFAGYGWFYRSWNRSIQSRAISSNARLSNGRPNGNQSFPAFALFPRILGRPLGAVARKDLLTFIREPAQWAQFTLVFGLLALYAGGLNRMHEQLANPRELYLVAYLNLSVSALALSTLTTRFVFPQFSLEGQKLWMLAMSPIKLSGIVMQKFITSAFATGLAVTVILLISCQSLRFDLPDTLFFAVSIFLLASGLNGLAVGLGVIFPDLRESNTAKIVSGFGGTLCLVTSFVYIIAFMMILVFARSDVFVKNMVIPDWYLQQKALLGFALNLLLTLLATALPLYFSQKSLKSGKIISNI